MNFIKNLIKKIIELFLDDNKYNIVLVKATIESETPDLPTGVGEILILDLTVTNGLVSDQSSIVGKLIESDGNKTLGTATIAPPRGISNGDQAIIINLNQQVDFNTFEGKIELKLTYPFTETIFSVNSQIVKYAYIP